MKPRRHRHRLLPALLALGLAGGVGVAVNRLEAQAPATPQKLGPGATFETLLAGKTVYQRVQVRSVNARTIMISHTGGIASVRLRDLSPELQVAFGYNPAAEADADSALREATARAEQLRAQESKTHAAETAKQLTRNGQFERLLQSFGQPPEIRPGGVDLRPKFFDLELNVKNQGARPSCAVFAIVSALEFQNAQLSGQADHFSEEYLVWATRKTLQRPVTITHVEIKNDEGDPVQSAEPTDEGFGLSEVVTALRAYGIPLQASLPYSYARNATAEPPPEVVQEAQSHRRVSVTSLPGRDSTTRIANLLHTLNAGLPIAVGMRWPAWSMVRTGYLSAQKPQLLGGHAVTIVGYENKTGTITDTVFIFKNSWGVHWGEGGYGRATYAYLANNLEDTALLSRAAGPMKMAFRSRIRPLRFLVRAILAGLPTVAWMVAAETPPPPQKLDPVIVNAAPLPLLKVDVDYHLRTARFGAAAVTDGTFIYVIGGSNSEDTPLDEIERFDPRTGRSEIFAHLAIGRRNHRAIIRGGRIYVLGGYNAVHFETTDFFERSVEVIDLKTRAVSRAPDMPVPKANFACTMAAGKLYVIGGAIRRPNAIVNTNTVETFDFTTGQWHAGVPMPTPRMSMAATVGNYVLVAGGYRGTRELAEVEAFFPDENGWRVLPPLHKPTGGNSLVFLDHFLFLFGGTDFIAYDLRTKQSETYRLDYTAAAETATVVLDGTVYVFGGTRGNKTTDASMAGFFLPAQVLAGEPHREPDEVSAELSAVSFSETDKLTMLLNQTKDYAAMDKVQVFQLRRLAK